MRYGAKDLWGACSSTHWELGTLTVAVCGQYWQSTIAGCDALGREGTLASSIQQPAGRIGEGAPRELLRSGARGGGVGALRKSDYAGPLPRVAQKGIATDFGMPISPIRFKILHASTASISCALACLARSLPPKICLYRKKVFSTRPCR